MSNEIKINLIPNVVELLKSRPEETYTAKELAKLFMQTYRKEAEFKKQKSEKINTDAALLTQIRSEIQLERLKSYPNIKSIEKSKEGKSCRQYYWTDKSDNQEIVQSETVLVSKNKTQQEKVSEHSLYPLLARFLKSEFNLYSLRIDEKKSSNKQGAGGNYWLHPDIVALEDNGETWGQLVKDCLKESSERRMRLWSFEVKRRLNMNNVREAYFQTMSNSSWANYAYLVAHEIQDCIRELNMLASSHGIGVILLNKEIPEESSVLIPARERIEIDWEMVNRLVNENTDFKNYIKAVKQSLLINGVVQTNWIIPKD